MLKLKISNDDEQKRQTSTNEISLSVVNWTGEVDFGSGRRACLWRLKEIPRKVKIEEESSNKTWRQQVPAIKVPEKLRQHDLNLGLREAQIP